MHAYKIEFGALPVGDVINTMKSKVLVKYTEFRTTF